MENKELRRLKRKDLLQMLLTQCEETERLQKELDETTTELETLQEGYERLKKKLDIKDERLNQKDGEIARQKAVIEEMKASRTIELEEAGSIAEAALRMNGIFEAAQRCADQYLMNVKRICRNETEKTAESELIKMPEIISGKLAVPEERTMPETYTASDRRTVHGQKIPYESGWGAVARRKKLHG